MTLMLLYVFNDYVQMAEVPVGLYIKLLKPPNTHYFIGVRKRCRFA